MVRQGAHQAAVKSTSTGTGERVTSSSKRGVVRSRTGLRTEAFMSGSFRVKGVQGSRHYSEPVMANGAETFILGAAVPERHPCPWPTIPPIPAALATARQP